MTNEWKELVVKYITGNASPKETLLVKQWIRESKANEQAYVELYESWHFALEQSGKQLDTERAWEKQLQTIHQTAKPSLKSMYRNLFRVAAILLMLCAIGYYFFNGFGGFQNQYYAAKGEKLKVVLEDGTIVWLNGGSSLKYNASFAKDNRTVVLDGEALFDIKPNSAGLPFIVQTDKFIIRDIGTVFNVKSYAKDLHFEAAVVQGEISIESKKGQADPLKEKVYLLQQQAVKIPTKDKKQHSSAQTAGKNDRRSIEALKIMSVTPVQMQAYSGWKDGVLMFDSERFEEIAHTLENVYDVNIRIENEALKNHLYSGTFRDKNNVEAILDIIKKTTPLTYTITGKTITIKTVE